MFRPELIPDSGAPLATPGPTAAGAELARSAVARPVAARARFISALAALAGGCVTLVTALELRAPTIAWVAFAIAAGVLLVVLGAFAVRGRGRLTRTLDVLTAVTCGWGIVAMRCFAGPHLLKWLAFGQGAAIAALGVLGLIVHEALVERGLAGA